MELKDFVKRTLIDIGTAMQEAHKDLIDMGGQGIRDANHTEIKFDIGVSVDRTSSTQGGGKLSVFSLGSAEIGADQSVSNSQQNRIAFSIKFHIKTAGEKALTTF